MPSTCSRGDRWLLPPFEADPSVIAGEVSQPQPSVCCMSEVDLAAEVATPVLDEMSERMWWVAVHRGSHIDPLHVQLLKGRRILVAEDPGLHLVWYYDVIYLKPVPDCLVDYATWLQLLPQRDTALDQASQQAYSASELDGTCKAALGLLRSYAFLIRHRSDYKIARDAQLLPDGLSFEQLQSISRKLRLLPDTFISPRYHYGQIRLTRLNWAVRLLRPRASGKRFPLAYQMQYWQTGQLLDIFVAPALFLFAGFSLVLSSMQVVLTAKGSATWAAYMDASVGFSVFIALMFVVSVVSVGLIVLAVFGLQLARAISEGRSRKKASAKLV